MAVAAEIPLADRLPVVVLLLVEPHLRSLDERARIRRPALGQVLADARRARVLEPVRVDQVLRVLLSVGCERRVPCQCRPADVSAGGDALAGWRGWGLVFLSMEDVVGLRSW
jgi:hypothetical protein